MIDILLGIILLYFGFKSFLKPSEVKNTDLSIESQGPTRANRNNNPGNLLFAGQKNAIGKDDKGFAVFKTIDDGWNALYRQIELDKQRDLTIEGFITKYAPSSENDTANYIEYMVQQLTAISKDEALEKFNTEYIAMAISKMEGYKA